MCWSTLTVGKGRGGEHVLMHSVMSCLMVQKELHVLNSCSVEHAIVTRSKINDGVIVT